MFEKNNVQTVGNEVVTDFSMPKYEIDLHIEILTSDYDLMRKEEILAYQLDVFEKKLENALAAGMSEIIFIHGIGNGVLKSEIHKRASKHPNIAFYEEAQKSKFGYGATFIKFK
jgi:dsDNA-specific endonuclease/ATPase MutS2